MFYDGAFTKQGTHLFELEGLLTYSTFRRMSFCIYCIGWSSRLFRINTISKTVEEISV